MMYLCCEILQNLTLLDGASMVDVCVCSWSRERRLCSELFSQTTDNPKYDLTPAYFCQPCAPFAPYRIKLGSKLTEMWPHMCPEARPLLIFSVFRIPINHVTVTHISHPAFFSNTYVRHARTCAYIKLLLKNVIIYLALCVDSGSCPGCR
jgi:hypothetical protein